MIEKIKEQAKKALPHIKKALSYFRIHDEKGLVSLTNIAMIIVLYKLCVTPAVSFQDITALATVVLGYQGKRLIERKKDNA